MLPAGRRSGGARVPDDEHLLARLDQTELAARQILDRGGIAPEPLDLEAEDGVFGLRRGEGLIEPLDLLTLLQHLQHAFVADEGVQHHHAAHDGEPVLQDAPPVASGDQPAQRGLSVLLHGLIGVGTARPGSGSDYSPA